VPKKIEISHKTIIFTVFFLIFLSFLVAVKEIISWFFISFIIMSALKPSVDYLERHRWPRVLAILIDYVVIILFLVFTVSTIIPLLVTQTLHLAERLPVYLNLILPNININLTDFSREISSLGQNILQVSVGIFNNIIAGFTIMVITFYLLLERAKLKGYLTQFFGTASGEKIISVFNSVEERLGDWVRGQLTLLLSIGLITYIGLVLLNIPFALPLAIMAGLLEIIPTLGPILAAIPAIIVSLTVSSLHPMFVALFYFIIQQLENQIIVPLIMNKIVGIPPLVTILAILVGVKVGGLGGVVLAVPVMVTVETVFTRFFLIKDAIKKPAERYSNGN